MSAGGGLERGLVLLAIARESLEEAFALGYAAARDDAWLAEPGACFITLRRQGRLRGCVGSIRARRPLGRDVQANARAAAFEDSRFPPLAMEELVEVRVEVSLLSPLVPLPCASEEEAIARLAPGVHGVVLRCRGLSGTFLPQVWGQFPDPRDFLRHLRHKAGLPPDFWDGEVALERYTVEKWAEPGDGQ